MWIGQAEERERECACLCVVCCVLCAGGSRPCNLSFLQLGASVSSWNANSPALEGKSHLNCLFSSFPLCDLELCRLSTENCCRVWFCWWVLVPRSWDANLLRLRALGGVSHIISAFCNWSSAFCGMQKGSLLGLLCLLMCLHALLMKAASWGRGGEVQYWVCEGFTRTGCLSARGFRSCGCMRGCSECGAICLLSIFGNFAQFGFVHLTLMVLCYHSKVGVAISVVTFFLNLC